MKILKKIIIVISVLLLLFIISFSYLWIRMINEVQSVATGDESLVCIFDERRAERYFGDLGLDSEFLSGKTYIKGEKIYTVFEDESGKFFSIITASGDSYKWSYVDTYINEYSHTDERWFSIWLIAYVGKEQGSIEILRSSIEEGFNPFAFYALPFYANYYYIHDCFKEKIDEDLMSVPRDVRFFERTSSYKNFDCDDDSYLYLSEGRWFFYEGEEDIAFQLRSWELEGIIMIKEGDDLYVSEDGDYVFKKIDNAYRLEKNEEVIYSECEMLEI